MNREGTVTRQEAEEYYSSTEDSGRELYERFVDGRWYVSFMAGTFDTYDAIIHDEDGMALVEIKKRSARYPSTAFKRDGWMIEKGKLKRLRKIRDKYFTPDTGIIYVNIYADGVIRCWDMDPIVEDLEERTGTFSNLGSADAWHKKEKTHFGLFPEQAYIDVEWGVTYG